MKEWVTSNLRILILFPAVFGLSSFLFSLLSWDWTVHRAPESGSGMALSTVASLLIHMGAHAALGALVALPTRKGVLVLAGAVASMLVDMDHAGSMFGLPLGMRTSHSVFFALAAFLAVFLLSRKGFFGLSIQPLVLGSLAAAAVAAHLALDSLVGDGYFPILMPFSYRHFFLAPVWGALLEIVAIAAVWSSTAMRPSRCYN